MKVKWTDLALLEMKDIVSFIEKNNPHSAELVGQRLWDASQRLSEQPKMGHEGYVEGTRELVVLKTSCTLVYRIDSDVLEIVHTYSDRQNWRIH